MTGCFFIQMPRNLMQIILLYAGKLDDYTHSCMYGIWRFYYKYIPLIERNGTVD